MHRSSESIGAIAAALAKAQTELINPEKSLVGIIGPSSPREPGRSFRYRAALKSRARASVATQSQSCSPLQSIKTPVSSVSTPCWPIRRENGCAQNGRCARLAIPPRHNGWAQHLPMRGVTHYSPSLALPGRMILMLPISRCSAHSLWKR